MTMTRGAAGGRWQRGGGTNEAGSSTHSGEEADGGSAWVPPPRAQDRSVREIEEIAVVTGKMAATSVNASVALPARQLSLGVEHEALEPVHMPVMLVTRMTQV
ncbi:hypothetical protein PC112_g4736 [Phytophthora cactorum]|nr:hypothetical protein PC112_g4736 [Phytophthora cactorum]